MSAKHQVNYNDLKTLWYCVRYRSFTRAAKALNKTQPTVSSSMKRLTRQLNANLFIRKDRKKGMVPTQKAIELAMIIEPLIKTID